MDTIQINEEGILKLLRNINPRKASGPDNIPASILRDCASDLAPILTLIFQTSLIEGKVPDDWTQANVTAIYKKSSRQDPANYMPVPLQAYAASYLSISLSVRPWNTWKDIRSYMTANMVSEQGGAAKLNSSPSPMSWQNRLTRGPRQTLLYSTLARRSTGYHTWDSSRRSITMAFEAGLSYYSPPS